MKHEFYLCLQHYMVADAALLFPSPHIPRRELEHRVEILKCSAILLHLSMYARICLLISLSFIVCFELPSIGLFNKYCHILHLDSVCNILGNLHQQLTIRKKVSHHFYLPILCIYGCREFNVSPLSGLQLSSNPFHHLVRALAFGWCI